MSDAAFGNGQVRPVPVGIAQLDSVLGGGFPAGTTTLVHGPSFAGKEHLARRAMLANLHAGRPVIMVLTNATATDVRAEMARLDPQFSAFESAGLAWFIDVYSIAIDADEPAPNVQYVDGPLDTNGLALAIGQVQKQLIADGPDQPDHVLILDSASTLVLYANAPATFRFLQVLTGRARRGGATVLVLLDAGMHAPQEVQMFRHLAHGMIDMAENEGRTRLRIHSPALRRDPGWVEYAFDDLGIHITGSLAAGRIR